MQGIAHRALETTDAQEYLQIVLAFMASCSEARELVDINIAAGVAGEEIEAYREKLLSPESPGPLRSVA